MKRVCLIATMAMLCTGAATPGPELWQGTYVGEPLTRVLSSVKGAERKRGDFTLGGYTPLAEPGLVKAAGMMGVARFFFDDAEKLRGVQLKLFSGDPDATSAAMGELNLIYGHPNACAPYEGAANVCLWKRHGTLIKADDNRVVMTITYLQMKSDGL